MLNGECTALNTMISIRQFKKDEGELMIKITKAGQDALAEYTGNNNRKDVRIIVAGYG